MNTQNFIVSKIQIELDIKLIPYDLWATQVHVLMLFKQGILSEVIAKKILTVLVSLSKCKFTINPNIGLHLTIEEKMIEKIGDDGFFMHTARSRNDEVATAENLYLRERLLNLLEKLVSFQHDLLIFTEKNRDRVMPGYTHMQPAKPTTFGQWSVSYFDMFSKYIDIVPFLWNKYDYCPLGSVESYGTSWDIDRNFTSKFLGFSRVGEIPIEAISCRGFLQMDFLWLLKNLMIIFSKLAQDLLLFSTFEYGFIYLSSSIAVQMDPVTGSSIMPQKKNPDCLELVRATSSQVIGFESIVSNLLSNLPSGYNRDGREVKEYIELGFEKTEAVIEIMSEVITGLKVDYKRAREQVIANYSLSTDLADFLAQKYKLPYRKVYKIVGTLVRDLKSKGAPLSKITKEELIAAAKDCGIKLLVKDTDLIEALDPNVAVSKRKHIGGSAGKIMVKIVEKRKKLLIKPKTWIKNKWKKIDLAKRKTKEEIKIIIK